MKAIIVAAGLGSRMQELTEARPKCSLPINDQPIFDHQLDALRAIGIYDISVVVGHSADFFDNYPEVKKYSNPHYKQNNVLLSLMAAGSEMDSDMVVCYSDIIYREDVLRNLFPLQAHFTAVADVDWRETYVGRSDHPVSQAENVVITNGLIETIGKHVEADESSAEFIGIFALSKEGCAIWKDVFDDVRSRFSEHPFQQAATLNNAYLTDMIQELIDRGFPVTTHLIKGGWMEIDTEQDYRSAQHAFRK